MREELERKHPGKHIVIRDKKRLGIYDNFQQAAKAAAEEYGSGGNIHYLIRRIGPEQPVNRGGLDLFIFWYLFQNIIKSFKNK